MRRLRSSKKEQMFENKTSMQKVLELFFSSQYKEFTLTDVAGQSGVSKSQASSIVKGLSKKEIIVLKELGKKVWRIRANNESFEFKKRKIAYNLALIYSTRIVETLNEIYKNPKAIILFGSFRWGENGENSDIDIAIEVVKEKAIEILELKELEEIGKALGEKIKIHVFNRKKIDRNLLANIANGIVLYGFLEIYE